ncbi:MAG: lipoate--protein ligase family protein [Gemmataceae bacterium]
MLFYDLTLPSIEENLALDEALLLCAEGRYHFPPLLDRPCLRVWETTAPAVVLGASNRLAEAVYQAACRQDRVPIARRLSGGGAVLLAPGCLNFSLILPYSPVLAPADTYFNRVLMPIVQALRIQGLTIAPPSDLVWKNRKVSGNAQRRLARYMLHHGTLLYQFPTELMERYLPMPQRQPAYRCGRSHTHFVTNLPLDRPALVAGLQRAWQAMEPAQDWPRDLVSHLLHLRYGRQEWVQRL